MKYYTIYSVTNNINGKIYIGKHQTKNIEDGYMGSGRLIREAIEDIEEQIDPLDVEAFFFKYFDGEKSTAWTECNAKKFYERYCRVANKVKVYIKNIETRRLKIKSIWYNIAHYN